MLGALIHAGLPLPLALGPRDAAVIRGEGRLLFALAREVHTPLVHEAMLPHIVVHRPRRLLLVLEGADVVRFPAVADLRVPLPALFVPAHAPEAAALPTRILLAPTMTAAAIQR